MAKPTAREVVTNRAVQRIIDQHGEAAVEALILDLKRQGAESTAVTWLASMGRRAAAAIPSLELLARDHPRRAVAIERFISHIKNDHRLLLQISPELIPPPDENRPST